MMKTYTITFPPELMAKVDAAALATQVSRAAILRQAAQLYWDELCQAARFERALDRIRAEKQQREGK